MPELARHRGEEYHNLRPVILLLCFIWGVGMGFSLNFFRSPTIDSQSTAQDMALQSAQKPLGNAQARQPTDIERRHAGTPTIAPIEPTPAAVRRDRLSFEDVEVGPPAVILTIEGGLTGKSVGRSSDTRHLQPSTTWPASVPSTPAAPLIPDLNPY